MHNLEVTAIHICVSEGKSNAKKRKNMIEIGSIAFFITSQEKAGKIKT